MATVKSFKQQCPSCEAMVPVRDPGLIGRKIDCPKCKYRFVVQEPADDAEADAPKKGDKVTNKPKAGAAAAKGAAAKKGGPSKRGGEEEKSVKKKGGNTMVLGIALAVLGFVAIGFGAWAFWPSGDSKSASSNNAPPPPPPAGEDDVKPGPEPAGPGVLVNTTNLLPNDAKAVISYPMSRTLGSSLKTLAMEKAGRIAARASRTSSASPSRR